MRTVRVLSRHCLLQSWLNHCCVKGLFTHSGTSRYQSRGTGEVPALVHLTSPTTTELLLLQHFFLLHARKAMVYYPDLVFLLLRDYKTASCCYFPLFQLNLQSSKKMNQARITSQRMSNCEKQEVWKPSSGWDRTVNWDSGCVLVPLCACRCISPQPRRQHPAQAQKRLARALSCC